VVTRRHFLLGTAATAVLASSKLPAAEGSTGPIIVTNWEHAPDANKAGWAILDKGGSALDAVEAGINYVELHPNQPWVGFGGSPNAVGETTLDAMMMWGPTHDVGAVGCLKRVKKAVSVARKVMESTRHTFLVGEDATRFAVEMGFDETSLSNKHSVQMWEEWAAKGEKPDAWLPEPRDATAKVKGHDTVGSLAIDAQGNICAGCSTNGLGFKLPGRVGDSPVAGAGAYCDNDIGGAIATGNGDVMMRFLPSYHAVELMREGASPGEAAREALMRIVAKGFHIDGAIVTLNKQGQHGAASLGTWGGGKFEYSVHNRQGPSRTPVESL
jgi:N4-(beta-N-acetylglucosaminyl)-L-asparaginase